LIDVWRVPVVGSGPTLPIATPTTLSLGLDMNSPRLRAPSSTSTRQSTSINGPPDRPGLTRPPGNAAPGGNTSFTAMRGASRVRGSVCVCVYAEEQSLSTRGSGRQLEQGVAGRQRRVLEEGVRARPPAVCDPHAPSGTRTPWGRGAATTCEHATGHAHTQQPSAPSHGTVSKLLQASLHKPSTTSPPTSAPRKNLYRQLKGCEVLLRPLPPLPSPPLRLSPPPLFPRPPRSLFLTSLEGTLRAAATASEFETWSHTPSEARTRTQGVQCRRSNTCTWGTAVMYGT
jgi:hypothetical protein